jgi:hypothetical protein
MMVGAMFRDVHLIHVIQFGIQVLRFDIFDSRGFPLVSGILTGSEF